MATDSRIRSLTTFQYNYVRSFDAKQCSADVRTCRPRLGLPGNLIAGKLYQPPCSFSCQKLESYDQHPATMNECCTTGFLWNGTPAGRIDKLLDKPAYIAGDNSKRAILLVHDVFGWSLNNTRLLADHYAKEVGATVYLPDFFEGWSAKEGDAEMEVKDGKVTMITNPDVDWAGFFAKNGPDVRTPEVIACARKLGEDYEFVGAVGFCWGGAVGFKLASEDNAGLLDCVTTAHPGKPSEEDVRNLSIPVQIIAPEFDPTFDQESKDLCLREIPKLGIEFVYNYFPGDVHGFCTKADMSSEKQKRSLERAKNAVVYWFLTHTA